METQRYLLQSHHKLCESGLSGGARKSSLVNTASMHKVTRMNFLSRNEQQLSARSETQESDSTKIDSIHNNVQLINKTTIRTEDKVDALSNAVDTGFKTTQENFSEVGEVMVDLKNEIEQMKNQQKLDQISFFAITACMGVLLISAGGGLLIGLGATILAGSLIMGYSRGCWSDACSMLIKWGISTVVQAAKKNK